MGPDHELLVGGAPFGEHVSWEGDTLVATSAHLAQWLDRPHLSVSTAKTFHRCPASFVADRSLSGGFNVMGAAEIGNAAHTVMERLMNLHPPMRDEEHAARILLGLLMDEPGPDDEDYARHLSTDPVRRLQWTSAVTAAYSGLFKIEDPRDVDVVATEMRIADIELGGVPFKGFIDRIDRINRRGEKVLRVVDYKSGKPKLRKPQAGHDDAHGDQIKSYTEAVEAMLGERPKEGVLYYTGPGGGTRRVAVSKAETRKTLAWMRDVWAEFTASRDSGEYPARPSPLCGWCPLVNACPAAAATGKTDRKGGAPSAVDLGLPTIRPAEGREVTPPPTFIDEDLPKEWRADDMATETQEQTERAVWAEARAWDGVLIQTAAGAYPNLASYAASTTYGLVALAVEVLSEAKQQLTKANIAAMANTLSTLHRKAQRKVTGTDVPDAGAATRMSGTLRAALEVTPPPFGSDLATWNQWANTVVRRAVAIAETANEILVDGPNTNYPWSAFAASDEHADDPFDAPVGAAN